VEWYGKCVVVVLVRGRDIYFWKHGFAMIKKERAGGHSLVESPMRDRLIETACLDRLATDDF
jgi:hypothetical protein